MNPKKDLDNSWDFTVSRADGDSGILMRQLPLA